MQILLLLYLAHYLGDFPLQTNWIYLQKLKTFKGGIFHALSIFLALILCLLPFLNNVWIWITIISITLIHYLQDSAKIMFNEKVEKEVLGYFSDQFIHIVMTTFFWFIFLKDRSFNPWFDDIFYQNTFIIVFLIGLIWVTSFLEITYYVIKTAGDNDRDPMQNNLKRVIL
ncbi:MAG: DUF3307 domain-containing protein, partial [Minisyncoccales bacterium]